MRTIHTVSVEPAAFEQADSARWTAGMLRHLVAALAGDPVTVTLDADNGWSVVGAYLLAVTSVVGGDDVVEVEYDGGRTENVLVSVADLGATITPLVQRGATSTRSRAVQAYRAERDAAIELVQREFRFSDAPHLCTSIRWTATPGVDRVAVVGTFFGAGDTDLGAEWAVDVTLDRLPALSHG
jgi:hypothetical protein